MADLAPYPDIHDLMREALPPLVPTDRVGTATPADLAEVLPFVRVRRIGGADDLVTDRPRFDVEVHAATSAEAWRLARDIQQRLITGPRASASGVLDQCRTESGPQEMPHPNDDVRLVIATYRGAVRR